MYESKYVADRIRSRSKECSITQKAMLAEAGLGGNTMSHLDNGKSIAADSLGKIADVLTCSVDYLLGRTENSKVANDISKESLTDDEVELIQYFRALGKVGRRHVLSFAENEVNTEAEKGTGAVIA